MLGMCQAESRSPAAQKMAVELVMLSVWSGAWHPEGATEVCGVMAVTEVIGCWYCVTRTELAGQMPPLYR